MKKIVTCLLATMLIVACGPKAKKQASAPWLQNGAFKTNLSKEDAQKGYDKLLKGKKSRGSAFRSGEVATADVKLLGFIAGANFSEFSIALILQNKDLLEESSKGLLALAERVGPVGDYDWRQDFVALVQALNSGAVTREEGAAKITNIGMKLIQASATQNLDFAAQAAAGYRFFETGILLGSGRSAPHYTELLQQYLAAYQNSLSNETIADLQKVDVMQQNAANDNDRNAAGNLLLNTIAKLNLA